MTAFACIETSTITRGLLILDALLKRAPVRVLHADRHSPGKYVLFIEGDVASVEESRDEALETVGDGLLDQVFLPQPHDVLRQGIAGVYSAYTGDAILIVETKHVSSALSALDYSLKLIDSTLIDLQLAQTIGGKGYFVLEGALSDIDYVRSEVQHAFSERLLSADILSRPHEDLISAFPQRNPFAAGSR